MTALSESGKSPPGAGGRGGGDDPGRPGGEGGGGSAAPGRFGKLDAALGLVFLAGAAAFVAGIAGRAPLRAWQVFLVNFLFWSGIAQAGVVFSAMLRVTNARWGRPLKRVAEATAAFLPFSFLCFLILFLGRNHLFRWIQDPPPGKAAWLNAPFFFAREGAGLLLLYVLSGVFVYYSTYTEVTALGMRGTRPAADARREGERKVRRAQRILGRLAPALLILYAWVFTLLAFDLVMSLDRQWYSTLFGGFYFIGNLYLGMAFITAAAFLLRTRMGLEAYITLDQFHDMGKLLHAFSMLWGYLLFSQYIVIWYGNLPVETGFVVLRTRVAPWAGLSLAVLSLSLVLPFFLLLSRRVKRAPRLLFGVSCAILAGMWLERFVLAVPSLWRGPALPLGWTEALVTGGFFAVFVLSYQWFLRTFPILPSGGPGLPAGSDHKEGHAGASPEGS